jgi:hypothetical protein
MTAPRAMTAAVIGLPTRSQGEAAFLRRQRAQVRAGRPTGGLGCGNGPMILRLVHRVAVSSCAGAALFAVTTGAGLIGKRSDWRSGPAR